MKKTSNTSNAIAALRRRAEARLRARHAHRQPKPGDPKAEVTPQRLLHELQVHQVELEMQNAELQESRDRMEALLERYTDLYDFAPAGYFSLDEQGRILEANLTGAVLLGVDRSRLLKRRLPVDPASLPVFLTFLKHVLAGTGKQSCEVVLLKESGVTFWASLQGISAISVSDPRKWCRVAVADITSLKQAEDVLRRNEALFSALIQQAPVGVYVVDSQLRLQQVNPKALPAFNKIHPLNGADFSRIIHIMWPEKVADEILQRFRHTLKTGEPYYSPEFSERRRDNGATECYEWQLQRITLFAGQHGVVCFFNNITERKRVEASQRRIEVLAADGGRPQEKRAAPNPVVETVARNAGTTAASFPPDSPGTGGRTKTHQPRVA
jgi:PAS domain S-box-containing protein